MAIFANNRKKLINKSNKVTNKKTDLSFLSSGHTACSGCGQLTAPRRSCVACRGCDFNERHRLFGGYHDRLSDERLGFALDSFFI